MCAGESGGLALEVPTTDCQNNQLSIQKAQHLSILALNHIGFASTILEDQFQRQDDLSVVSERGCYARDCRLADALGV
jgi:hypothetical protein